MRQRGTWRALTSLWYDTGMRRLLLHAGCTLLRQRRLYYQNAFWYSNNFPVIQMPFWTKTRVGPRNHVLDGVQIPQGKKIPFRKGPFKSIGNLRCSVAAAFAAKWISQSPITSFSRRDHSVCQASANSILKISGQGRCGLSAAKGWWNCTEWAKSYIYDYLAITCN